MFKSFKRLAAAFLIAVLLIGTFSATSAEAAMKKPGNCRFVQWNNTAFSAATIAWNPVSGADFYQVKCVWTDGSHNVGGYVSASYNGVKISNLNYKHVYQAQVRAIKVNSSGSITAYSPWSNLVFITPWPKNISAKLSGSKNVKLNWNIIYGSNGYNVFLATNPSGKWYWNLSTSTKATATSATIKKYRGSSFKKYQNYYVRVITRRKRNGVFCTVPEPYSSYYQYRFYIYTVYK
ncbi:MAG: hypothetical protein E7237_03225 [Sarcina sp.]|nr:hypothetical protein [Sarcina sp.]